MAGLTNFNDFFRPESKIVEKMAYQGYSKYECPRLQDKDKNFVFDKIALILFKIGSDELEKGYLDLDDMWLNYNPQEEVKTWVLGTPDVKALWMYVLSARKSLKDQYPTPYSGRRIYVHNITVQKEKIYIPKMESGPPGEEDIIVRDKDGKIVYEQNEYGSNKFERTGKRIFGDIKESSNKKYFFSSKVNVMHNVELGWTDKPKTRKENVNGVLKEVAIPQEEVQNEYHRCNCFVQEEKGKELIALVQPYIDENPELESFFMLFIGSIKKGEFKNKPSHTFNVDDFIPQVFID